MPWAEALVHVLVSIQFDLDGQPLQIVGVTVGRILIVTPESRGGVTVGIIADDAVAMVGLIAHRYCSFSMSDRLECQ